MYYYLKCGYNKIYGEVLRLLELTIFTQLDYLYTTNSPQKESSSVKFYPFIDIYHQGQNG